MPIQFPTSPQSIFSAQPPSLQHPMPSYPQVVPRDTLAASKQKASEESLFTRVWNSITSFISWIFCGCYHSKEEVKEDIQKPQMGLNEKFAKIKDEFIEKRDGDKSEGKSLFKMWWSDHFANLPDEIKDRLIQEDMRSTAVYQLIQESQKKDDAIQILPTEEAIDQRVEQMWLDPKGRVPSIKFVQLLDYVPQDAAYYGSPDKIPNPLQDVPKLIDQILTKLENPSK